MDDFKETALMKASEGQHLEVMKVLIEAGADVNAADDFGETALMQASEGKHLEMLTKTVAGGNVVDNFKRILIPFKNEIKRYVVDMFKTGAHKRPYNFKEILNKLVLKSTSPKTLLKLVLASTLLWVGLFLVISPFYAKLTCTSETVARVVDRVSSTTEHGDLLYAPVFSYNTRETQIVVRHDTATNINPYEIGDTLILFYNPNKPERYYIEGLVDGNMSRIPIGLILIGLFILIIKKEINDVL